MIFLDEQTRPYLERLMVKTLEAHPKDFIAERILKMVRADKHGVKTVANCIHEYSKYIGKKECCVYCGTLGEGMSEVWTKKNN